MNILQALILGIIQGITEFLPVSSTAHLIIIPYLLRWTLSNEQVILFHIFIQWGTLIALVVFFHSDLLDLCRAFINSIKSRRPFQNEKSRLSWLILISLPPAVIADFLLINKVESIFSNPLITAFFLFGTAFLLIIAEVIGKRIHTIEALTWKNAIILGFFQAISILPGISRAGSCISGGMIQDLNRKDAARFSFLIGIPLLLISGINNIIDLINIQNLSQYLPSLLIGFIAAGLVGYFVLQWLLSYLSHHSLLPFAFYCILLGVFVIGNGLFISHPSLETTQTAKSQTINMTYPSSLRWVIPIALKCNATNSVLTLRFSFDSNNSSSTEAVAITYQPDVKPNISPYLLGHENFVIAVNSANPVSSLTLDQVSEIFMGTNKTWGDFSKSCNQCVSFTDATSFAEKDLTTWVYPPTSMEQTILQNIIMKENFLSVNAIVAPDPQALLEAIRFNPAAIGILPEHWLDKTIKSINIRDAGKNDLLFPILANVPSDLLETVKPLLLCIEHSIES